MSEDVEKKDGSLLNGEEEAETGENSEQTLNVIRNGVRLVLNGGKREMDAATIPIQWFFSDEVIAKNPSHLLFFEQTKEESKLYHNGNHGRRYVCKVSEGTKFIQLFSPGYHRIMVLVFRDKDSEEKDTKRVLRELLSTVGKDNHEVTLNWQKAADGNSEWGRYFSQKGALAVSVVEFYVPEELFAKKPETKFQKAVWNWVNLWHKQPPRDECQYRERKIIAFTLKPIPWLISSILKFGWLVLRYLGRIAGATYLILGSGCVLFCGFRPKPLWKRVANLVRNGGFSDDHLELTRYKSYHRNYKLWLREGIYWDDDLEKHVTVQEEKRMSFAPWEFCMLILLAWPVILFSTVWLKKDWIFIIVYLIFSVILVALAINLIIQIIHKFRALLPGKTAEELAQQAKIEEERRLQKKRREAEKLARINQEKAKREDDYRNWLRENYSFSQKSDKVDLTKIPAAFNPGERVAQIFRVSFWSLKAKVCRPFSR